jgi:hypothetical protein
LKQEGFFAMTKFSSIYPNIAAWTESHGWIEIGQDDNSHSFVRALDMGGMVWEGKPKYKSVDAPLMTWKRRSKILLRRLGKISPYKFFIPLPQYRRVDRVLRLD